MVNLDTFIISPSFSIYKKEIIHHFCLRKYIFSDKKNSVKIYYGHAYTYIPKSFVNSSFKGRLNKQ